MVHLRFRLPLILPFLLLGAIAQAQSPCVNGMAGGYPCENIDLVAFMALDELGGGNANDIWGWVDPADGTEYVLMGRTNGTAFVNISDPVNPFLVADLPTQTTSTLWRDIKVYGNHAFIVSEASGHGMQVVDLTQLGSIANPPVMIQPDAWYSGFGNAHNIVINPAQARAYGVGTDTFQGGLHIVDISDPLNPTAMGSFADGGYSHDAQVVSYIGPDEAFQGKEVAFCFNGDNLTIADVTDPTDPTLVSSTGYSSSAYTHQGWLTEDHRYVLLGDELDEGAINTRTYIFDVQDLANPELIGTHVGATPAIDHNMYTHEGLVYQSNYTAGLRILDTDAVANGQLEEVAYFDVYPQDDAPSFSGTWSNYPYFPSGVIAVTNMSEGLFLVQAAGDLSIYGCTDSLACNFDPDALEDNGSCLDFNVCGGCEGEELFCVGCTDADACNYAETATIDDSTCFQIEAPEAQSAVQTTEPITFTGDAGTHWYESEADQAPFLIGDSYTLPLLTVDGSVWAANSNGEYGVTGGKPEADFDNGQFHINNNYWMRFDVHLDAVLESVEVYSEGGGIQITEIVSPDGSVLSSTNQMLDPGLNVLTLNAQLPAGEGYGIRSGNDQPLLWREDSGAEVNYPYEIGNIASITSTTITGQNQYTYYYFYYNWKMSTISPCQSEKVEFTVTVEDVSSVGSLTGAAARELVKTIDITGREVEQADRQMVFRLFSDGSVEKAIATDRD